MSDSNLVHFFALDPRQKSLREVQQILNSTEGNFHQLVALLNCRGLNKVTEEAAAAPLRRDPGRLLSSSCALAFLCRTTLTL